MEPWRLRLGREPKPTWSEEWARLGELRRGQGQVLVCFRKSLPPLLRELRR